MSGLTLTWKVENFLLNTCLHGNYLLSPEFTMKINESNTKWRLKIYPSRMRARIRYNLVRIDAEEPEEISVNCMLSCITADDSIQPAISIDHCKFNTASIHHEFCNESEWRSMLEERSLYFPNGSFTVQCRIWSSSLKAIQSAEYYALSSLEVTKVSFWKSIDDFSALHAVPPMRCYPLPSCNVEISLFKKADSDYLSVVFHCKTTTISEICLNAKLSAQNFRGIPLQEMEKDYLFKKNENIFKFPDFIEISNLTEEDQYYEDALNLQFELTMHMGKIHSKINKRKVIRSLPITKPDYSDFDSLCREFETLYSEKKYADVQLKSGNETFIAHKVILHARSPVFAAMFDRDMVEKNTGVVQVDDIDPSTLDKLLIYMYSGVVRKLDEDTAVKLLYAADKYGVLTLKETCASFLENLISADNVCLMLQLGDSLRENSLKRAAKDFICDHHHHIFSTDEWLYLAKNHGEVASEIFQKLSIKYNNV